MLFNWRWFIPSQCDLVRVQYDAKFVLNGSTNFASRLAFPWAVTQHLQALWSSKNSNLKNSFFFFLLFQLFVKTEPIQDTTWSSLLMSSLQFASRSSPPAVRAVLSTLSTRLRSQTPTLRWPPASSIGKKCRFRRSRITWTHAV